MDWIEIVGSNCTAIGGNIQYIPPAKPEHKEGSESTPPDDELISYHEAKRSEIKSAEYFGNGRIEFKVKFESQKARLTIFLNEDKLAFGINVLVSRSLFSIRTKKPGESRFQVLANSGEIFNLDLKKEYRIAIEVQGSEVMFYVNDVQVCRAQELVIRSQIVLFLSSTESIAITDFVIKTQKPKVFVVMQFTPEFNELYTDVIKPVCERYNFEVIRADEFYQNSLILNDIIQSIKESTLIIAEITPDNPNVFYEIGYSHALNKPTILLADKKREKLPFDVSGFRTLFYDNTIGGKTKVEERLKLHLENLKANK